MRDTAIYVRQSADRADSVSLETQEQLCRRDTSPAEKVRVYADRGFSGKNTARPALRAMMQAVSRGEIGRVLVYRLDRISRNLADFTRLLADFDAQHVEFLSYTERFETASPMGQAMRSLLMVFAQLERETISGRVRDAAFARAKAGFDTGGAPPLGYRRIPALCMGKRTGMFAPDDRAPAVAAAFSRYLAPDVSLTTIARAWNSAGFRTARGGEWSAGTLCRLLRNPVYAQADARIYAYLAARGAEIHAPEPLPEGHGIHLYADRRINSSRFTNLHGTMAVCALHRGIIAPEIWMACQEKLDSSRKIRTLGKGQRTWLSGIIFCRRCGCAMTVSRGRSADYLVCGGHKRGKCAGAGAVWRVAAAEEMVGTVLSERLRELSGTILPAAGDAAQRAEVDALTLRLGEIVQMMTQPQGAAIAELASAAQQIRGEIARKTANLRGNPVCRGDMPAWEECDTVQRRMLAALLIRGIFADGESLEIYLS